MTWMFLTKLRVTLLQGNVWPKICTCTEYVKQTKPLIYKVLKALAINGHVLDQNTQMWWNLRLGSNRVNRASIRTPRVIPKAVKIEMIVIPCSLKRVLILSPSVPISLSKNFMIDSLI